MPDNVYNFPRKDDAAEPKPLKMIGALKRKPSSPRYFAGLVVLCVLVGFVAVRAWPSYLPPWPNPFPFRLPFRCGS